ncbi:MAG: FAD-dependent oxidoreductase [Candidatus Micrarchaeota archaeon]|nr:FAD-dependent oxidoreductase [Candidatus Micrarchaeota archaeon]
MTYDMIIIGTGVAGLAGAMYAGRMNMQVLAIGEMRGGTITTTNIVENYPGFISISGIELAEKLEQHARYYPSVQIKDEKVLEIKKDGKLFHVKTDAGSYTAKTILYAAGTVWKKLGVPGEERFANKGVHYCALCDAAFYKEKVVAVVGGGDTAAKDALVLSEWAKKVYIIYRGEKIHPEPINYERVIANKKIEIINKTNVLEIKGNGKVTSVVVDKPYNNSNEIQLDAVFIAIGHEPITDLAKKVGVQLDEKGYIKINRNCETNVEGFFAAGDVTDTRFKQAIVGVAEAVQAVYSAYLYLGKV